MIADMAQVIKMLSLTNFRSPLHGGSLTLYSSVWTILALHLLIIWVVTWVLIPSDTPLGLLWVCVAKVTLFRGLLHINAARVLAGVHLMGRQQLFLELLYRHTLVCLPVVLIFFFRRLHLSVSSSSLTSALASRGQSCSRRGLWAAMISHFLPMWLWALAWASDPVREVDSDWWALRPYITLYVLDKF